MISPLPGQWERNQARRSAERPALTALALLAAANPTVAEQLLRNPADAACAHPHYLVHLDDADRVVLARVRTGARSVREFLIHLADAIENDINEPTLTPASD